jgi:hypothetical protein
MNSNGNVTHTETLNNTLTFTKQIHSSSTLPFIEDLAKIVLVRYIKTYPRYKSTRQKPTTIEKINQNTCAFTPRRKHEGDTTVLLTSGGEGRFMIGMGRDGHIVSKIHGVPKGPQKHLAVNQ